MTVAFCNKHYQIYKTLVNQQLFKVSITSSIFKTSKTPKNNIVITLKSVKLNVPITPVGQPVSHIIVYLILTLANSGVGKVDKSVLTWPPVLLAARRFVTWTCSWKEHWMVRIWTFNQQILIFFLSKHNILYMVQCHLLNSRINMLLLVSLYFIKFYISSFSISMWLTKQCDCQSQVCTFCTSFHNLSANHCLFPHIYVYPILPNIDRYFQPN